MIFTLVLIVHVIVCLVLFGVILIQQGKGASMGAAFGTGGSQTVFGGSGAGNFLTKTTWVCAVIFFSTSLILAYQSSFRRSVVDTGTDTGTTAPKDTKADKGTKTDKKGAAGTATPSATKTATPTGTATKTPTPAANTAKTPTEAPTPAPAAPAKK
ncbi:MAG TPA: preprotein translocase subunit SecG [Myxococcales bacterium]|nr:preprotein translocase subunit SecG [Myxococcales bacterium]